MLSALSLQEWGDEIDTHTTRILIHTLKCLGMYYHGNEDIIFGSTEKNENGRETECILYSKFWTKKSPLSGAIKKRKSTNQIEDTDTEVPLGANMEERKSNVFLHNIIQNVRKDRRDKINVMGFYVLTESARVVSTLNQDVFGYFLKRSEDVPLAGFPTNITDFSKVVGIASFQTPYGEFCSFYRRHDDSEECEDDDNNENHFGELKQHLPSNYDSKVKGKKMECPQYLDFSYKDGTPHSPMTVTSSKLMYAKDWEYIEAGGGPFARFVSTAMQICNVFSIPFQFIAIALQNGSQKINPSNETWPFQDLSPADFLKSKYVPLQLDKKTTRFLDLGSHYIEPDTFNLKLMEYFLHLLNGAKKTFSPETKDCIVSEDNLETKELKDLSFGTFLLKCVDSVAYVCDHKVNQKLYLRI